MGVIDVGWAMAGGAAHSRGAEAIGTAHHKRLMGMLVLALQRTVGCRVAVHAPRMRDDLAGFLEQGDGTVLVTLDFGEIAQRPQGFGCRRLGAGLGVDAAGDQGRQCREEGDGLEVHLFAPHAFGTKREKGRSRMRWPVSLAQALPTAGAIGGTPGSPTPVGFSSDGTMNTSTFGISLMRKTR